MGILTQFYFTIQHSYARRSPSLLKKITQQTGNTGITAYIGLKHIGQPKAGETVVVSGAAGATGIIVGQIAKIHGCRVVGIAGSDDKCRLLVDELGFDVALNYKSPAFREELAKATPKYIDVYWDNVGGESEFYGFLFPFSFFFYMSTIPPFFTSPVKKYH